MAAETAGSDIEGTVGAAVFRAYVNHALVPTLRAGDVVIMDNLSAHKATDIELLITELVRN